MKKLLKNLIWLYIIGSLLFVQLFSICEVNENREEAVKKAILAAETSQSGYISREFFSIDEFKVLVKEFSNEVDSLCKSPEVINWASEKVSAEDVLVYVTGDNRVYRRDRYEENVENNVLSRYITSLLESDVTIPQNVKIVLKANNGEPIVEVIDLNNYSKVDI